MDPASGAETIVAVLRRRFQEHSNKTLRRQSGRLAASLEQGAQMELRDFVALLAALGMSLDDLSREVGTFRPPAIADEPAASLGGVGIERWLEEIR